MNYADNGLLDAVTQGQIDHIESWLKRGASLETQDDNGWTPLQHAIASHNLGIAKFLLQKRR